MSNRQARREQSRQSRQPRPTRSTRPTGRGGSSRSGGGPNLFSLPYLLGLGGLVVIFLVVIIVVMTRSGGSSDADLVKQIQEGHAAFPTDMVNGQSVGKADAPLKLDEYEDFQCPFCMKYTAEQERVLVDEYVKTGKVQLTYKQFPALGAESVRAAIATQCAADQGKFWELHYQLFLAQAEAGQLSNEKVNVGRFSDDKLRGFATQAGVDSAKFEQCFSSSATLDQVNEQQRAGRALGIRGTPSFVINGQPISGSGAPGSVDEWRTLLDGAAARLTSSPSPAAAGSPSPAATAAPSATPVPSATPAPSRTP